MYKVGGFTIETYSVGNCSIRSFRDKFDYITFLRTAQRSVSSKKFYNFDLWYFSQYSFIIIGGKYTFLALWAKFSVFFTNTGTNYYFLNTLIGKYIVNVLQFPQLTAHF